MTNPQPLDRHAFEAWLNTKKPDEIVGVTGHACRCPVATWQQWATCGPVMVSCEAITWGTPTRESSAALPPWLLRFVDDIDNSAVVETNVTASQALAVLRRIP